MLFDGKVIGDVMVLSGDIMDGCVDGVLGYWGREVGWGVVLVLRVSDCMIVVSGICGVVVCCCELICGLGKLFFLVKVIGF